MNKNQGFIKLILIIIIAVVILGYFRIDVRGVKVYLEETANFLYEIFYNYFWLSFMENIQRIGDYFYKYKGRTI